MVRFGFWRWRMVPVGLNTGLSGRKGSPELPAMGKSNYGDYLRFLLRTCK
jgi:hypothetical protein